MARQANPGELVTPIRKSRRIAGRRRGEIAESSRIGERNNQRQQIRFQIQQVQEANDRIDYDHVSVHTADTDTTDEDEQGTGDGGLIEKNEENMTTEELRQRLIEERMREEEACANLTRKNDELREENNRLQEERVNHRLEQQHDEDRYIQQGDYHRRGGNHQHVQQGKNERTHHGREDEADAEQARMILHSREILQNQRDQEEEDERQRDIWRNERHERNARDIRRRRIEEAEEREIQEEGRNNDAQVHARNERERRKIIREEAEEREILEVVRQNNHDNRLIHARMTRPMQQDANQAMNETILRELAEVRAMMDARKDG
ncbi:trichohyalin-like [Papaver somniferum]|uniref:trichohyalin-like n=1 Tax=Papaver somniferum TaxID=3469 RepID=UPI000E6F87E9|nr:trichohyalin-like [Papaver somniferum]